MKKILVFSLVLVFLIVGVQASAIATIGMQGLNMLNPEAAEIINTIVCLSNPLVCAEGKIISKIQNDLLGEIFEANPEIAKAVFTYNEVQSYIDLGAEILVDLEINDEGQMTEGTILFGNEEISDIGNLVGDGLEKEDISVKGMRLDKYEGISTFAFKESESNIEIKGKKFGDIQSESEANLPSYIRLNEEGKITNAEFTTNEKGGFYDLGEGYFEAPPNSRVEYDSESGEPPKIKIPQAEPVIEEGIVSIVDNHISELPKAEVIYEGDFILGQFEEHTEIKGLGGEIGKITVANGKIIKVWEGTDAAVKGINHKTFRGDLNLYYEEDFNPLKYKGENYFNYGENKIWLGGEGFTSYLNEGNEIFPEFIKNRHWKSYDPESERLGFGLLGGNLEITKISPENHPLGLEINAEGEFKIQNGKWLLTADEGEIYAEIDNEFSSYLETDIKLNYINEIGNQHFYDLDVDSKYKKPLTSEELENLQKENQKLEDTLQKNIQRFEPISKKHSIIKLERERNELQDNRLDELIKKSRLELDLTRSEGRGEFENSKEIKRKIKDSEKRIEDLTDQISLLGKNDKEYLEFLDLNSEINYIKYKIEGNKRTTKDERGFFGESLISNRGNTQISYSEFVRAFPVIKNTDVHFYGNSKIMSKNKDVLDLILSSKYQTCADTQIKLYSLWSLNELEKGNVNQIEIKISNGETLRYSNEAYTVWDENLKQVVTKESGEDLHEKFEDWVENVQVYSNTGSLREYLKMVTDLDKLLPGDILTLNPDPKSGYGHSKAIKEIVRIPPKTGELHYKLFAGSDPAIDARIYKKLYNKEDFLKLLKNGEGVISRFERT